MTGNVCFLTDPTDRTGGAASTDGLGAGRCRSTGAACNASLVCTNAATPPLVAACASPPWLSPATSSPPA
ncbi:MAG: hypothetical protein IPN17_32845 [Deltaproteobacteria bacterium]|nr:hypothetical protein [Deltaproteobacteria bacterium]